MNILGIIWLRDIITKLAQKHQVEPEEVDEIFDNRPRFRRIARGNVSGEDVYSATGQTDDGRYLIVFFIYKRSPEVLVISAREMSVKERKNYGQK